MSVETATESVPQQRRELFAAQGLVTDAPGVLRLHLAGFSVELVNVVEFDSHPGGDEAFGRMRREGPRPFVVPPEIG